MKANANRKKDDDLMALPFVKDDPAWARPGERGSLCFWAVESPADNAPQDWAKGEEYSKVALDYIIKTGDTPLLTHITEAMILKGNDLYGPDGRIIVGFMQNIARYAAYGWHIAQQARALPNGGMMIVRDKPLEPEEEEPAIDGIARPEPLPSVEIGGRPGRDLAYFRGQVQKS